VIRHDDAVACFQSQSLMLEEIVRRVKVDAFLPAFARFLMALQVGVMSYENSTFVLVPAGQFCLELGGSP
jgi:hypothetical protein